MILDIEARTDLLNMMAQNLERLERSEKSNFKWMNEIDKYSKYLEKKWNKKEIRGIYMVLYGLFANAIQVTSYLKITQYQFAILLNALAKGDIDTEEIRSLAKRAKGYASIIEENEPSLRWLNRFQKDIDKAMSDDEAGDDSD